MCIYAYKPNLKNAFNIVFITSHTGVIDKEIIVVGSFSVKIQIICLNVQTVRHL
jgi:hypothetical protein